MPTSPRSARRAVLARATITAAACVIAAGLAVTTAAVPASAAQAGPDDTRCAKRVDGATKVTQQVVVFEVADPTNGGSNVYACRRAGGPSLLIGYDAYDDGEYGSDSVVHRPQIAGRWVATWIETGGGSASQVSKDDPGAATPSSTWDRVRLIDTRSGRIADLPGAAAPRVAANGALAWADRGVLRTAFPKPRGRHSFTLTPRELDRGTAITSLRFAGTNLRWLRDGKERSAVVAR